MRNTLRRTACAVTSLVLIASYSHSTTSRIVEAQSASDTNTFDTLGQNDLQVITGNVQRPNGIRWFNNFLYTACTGDSTVYEISDSDGRTRTYIFGITNAHDMIVEGEGSGNRVSIWVPDYGDNTFEHITNGTVEQIANNLEGPWGIVQMDDETFIISELLGNSLSTITRDGEREVLLDTLASPAGITQDEDYLYVANNGSTRRAIEWYERDPLIAGQGSNEAGENILVRGLQNVAGLTMASDGNLYFTYALGTRGVVGRVNPTTCREQGGCTNDQVDIVLYSELAAPLAGLTVSPEMRLFVHTMYSPDIYWVQIEE